MRSLDYIAFFVLLFFTAFVLKPVVSWFGFDYQAFLNVYLALFVVVVITMIAIAQNDYVTKPWKEGGVK